MPVITMTLGGGQIGREQKQKFIEVVTKQAAEITNISQQAFIVTIQELDTDNIGVGGQVLTETMAKG